MSRKQTVQEPNLVLRSRRVLIVLVVAVPFPIKAESKIVPLTKTTNIEFVDAKKGSELLRQKDEFVENLSALDRQLRLQSADQLTSEDFVKFVSQQTLDWNEKELEKVTPLVENIAKQLIGFDIRLPEKIEIVKSNGKEEGNAAYCRGESTIVLPLRVLNRLPDQVQSTLTHELFHIVSRHDPSLRDKLYQTIGFRRATFEYPAALSARKITNPDAASISHFIELKMDDERTVTAVPITFSAKEKYDGGSLFDYVTFRLLVVQLENDNVSAKNPGDPELLDPSSQIDFFRQIGRNTGYIIHPEEILADNFVFMVSRKEGLPNPEIVAAMRDLLQRNEPAVKD